MSKLIFRLILVNLLSTASLAVQAQNVDFTSSNSPSTIETSSSLLFLQPGTGTLQYGTLVNPLPAESPHWVNQHIDPDYSPAFNVGVGYYLDSGRDIRLNWTHLNTSDSDTVFADPIQFVGPPYEIGPDAGSFKIGYGNAQFEFDAINLDVGQRFQSFGPVDLRVFGGLQLARIGEELTASFQTPDGITQNGYTNNSLFTGCGPRIGVKAQRSIGYFDFLGEFATAALLGNMESSMDFRAISPAFPVTPNIQSLTSPDATRVIPSIDARLGTGWTLPTANHGKLRLEAGYQVAVYVNAVNEYSISNVVLPSNVQGVGVFLRTQTPLQNDFTAQGPYMMLKWDF